MVTRAHRPNRPSRPTSKRLPTVRCLLRRRTLGLGWRLSCAYHPTGSALRTVTFFPVSPPPRPSWEKVDETAVLLFLLFDAKSRREERWLETKFPSYAEYRKRVRRLMPCVD